MKTTDIAIDVVCTALTGEEGLEVPVFMYKKPTKVDPDEYVVVNSLPINSGVLQKCIVNVNYYAKDIAPGIPDSEKLAAGNAAVVALLDGYSGAAFADFEQQQIEWDYALSRHYSNLRFSVKLIN
jgi:hypothetical protein